MRKILTLQQIKQTLFLLRWSVFGGITALVTGSLSALFLWLLDLVTSARGQYEWLYFLLPLAGLCIGLVYKHFGEKVSKGNNHILEEWHSPKTTIPFRMIPMVLISTLLTHLVGGSAGREGTAVQMGGAFADTVAHLLKVKFRERKIFLAIGMAAGFSSVFGTPLAGAVFALEVFTIGQIRYAAILPILLASVVADITCDWWGIQHTHYIVNNIPSLDLILLLSALAIGICSGLVSKLFVTGMHFIEKYSTIISYLPLRTAVGGMLILCAMFALGSTSYMGLGLEGISTSFSQQVGVEVFLLKITFTVLTLGVGYKGGEVTPLFFIGAALGSYLSILLPMPVALAAAIGFVSVFAGATNTPIACIIMSAELFGADSMVFCAIGIVAAYSFSGHAGIYQMQKIAIPKHPADIRDSGKTLSQIT